MEVGQFVTLEPQEEVHKLMKNSDNMVDYLVSTLAGSDSCLIFSRLLS